MSSCVVSVVSDREMMLPPITHFLHSRYSFIHYPHLLHPVLVLFELLGVRECDGIHALQGLTLHIRTPEGTRHIGHTYGLQAVKAQGRWHETRWSNGLRGRREIGLMGDSWAISHMRHCHCIRLLLSFIVVLSLLPFVAVHPCTHWPACHSPTTEQRQPQQPTESTCLQVARVWQVWPSAQVHHGSHTV